MSDTEAIRSETDAKFIERLRAAADYGREYGNHNVAYIYGQAADRLERAKKIEDAANAALGYVVGDAAYQRLAAALTPDPAPKEARDER